MKEVLLMCEQKTCEDSSERIFSQESADGHTHSDSLESQMTCQSGPEVVPVSHSVSLVNEKGSMMSGTSGPNLIDSYETARLQLYLENKLRERMVSNGSLEYAMTWKRITMLSGPPICALRAQTHRISGKDFTGELAGWSTPRANKWGFPDAHGSNETPILSGWPTPDTNQRGGAQDPMKRKAGGHSVTLQDMAHGVISMSSTAPTESKGALNPAHSLWLQGFPSDWLMAAPLKALRGKKSSKE